LSYVGAPETRPEMLYESLNGALDGPIAASIEASITASIAGPLDMVLFSAGGWRVGFEARGVRGARPAPTGATTNEIEALLGLPAAVARAPQVLAIKRPARDGQRGDEHDRDIIVDGPVELIGLPITAIHPLPPLLAARTRLHELRALALHPATAATAVLLLFDGEAACAD